MPADVVLRDMTDDDLPIFFAQRRDPQGNWMAAFTSRDPSDRDAFTAHWARVRADETIIIRTILVERQVAGNIACSRDFGDPEVRYWIGREFWGKGIATKALMAFLRQLLERPLYALVAKDNLASLRVLQKCGFTITGEEKEYSHARRQEVEGYSLILAGSADNTHDGKEGQAVAKGERVDSTNSTNSTNSTDDTPLASAGAEFLLRPDVAFLNHGSFGACPRPVFAEYQRWQRVLEEEPVEFLGRRLDDLLAEARAPLGAFLGTAPDNLVFVPNATYGMNVVARSYPLEPGDEVLGTTHEYGAVERTWTFICEAKGAQYRSQPITLPVTSAEALIEQLWQGVTPRTRALVISHITSPTALIFPVGEICRRAAAQGIVTIIDGAHAPGQIDLTLDDIGADFYTGNLHKWTCAPKGSAFLYARPDRQPMLQPLVVSWGWRAINPGPSPFQDYFGWTGTSDPAPYLSVPAAIAFQQQHGWPSVRATCHELVAAASQRIGKLTGLPPISPDSPDWYGQMRAIPIPRTSAAAQEVQQRLWNDFQIEVPIVDWQDQRFVRISIQAYNTRRDVGRLVAALSEMLNA